MLAFPSEEPAAPALPAGTARLCFDIEIANVFEQAPGKDLDDYGPFEISVAAAATDAGQVFHWYAKDAHGRPARSLDAGTAREVLAFLRAAQQRGIQVCAWNGLKFDLRWLAHAADDARLASEVARDLYDPFFQFFCARGFPISLASVADGLGLAERKLMEAAEAPRAWARGEHQRVLDYVAGDCRITSQVVARILERRAIRWRTQKGEYKSEAIRALLPVRELLPLPPPDQSWMSRPIHKGSFYSWLGWA